MTPITVTLADDVRKQLEARVQADGGSLDDTANDLMRVGLEQGSKWQRRVGPRDYAQEMAEAQSDDEAIQIATDAVHEQRAEQRGR